MTIAARSAEKPHMYVPLCNFRIYPSRPAVYGGGERGKMGYAIALL